MTMQNAPISEERNYNVVVIEHTVGNEVELISAPFDGHYYERYCLLRPIRRSKRTSFDQNKIEFYAGFQRSI